MTRRHLSILALGALIAGFLVALLLAPAWAARNTAFVVALIAVVAWNIVRGFVMGQIPEEDYSALASWLVLVRDLVLVALLAVFVAVLRERRAGARSR